MRRLPARSGRPLPASLAWAVLLLASGNEEAADRVVQHPATGRVPERGCESMR